MTDKFRVVDCPSCGAPLEMPRERKRFFQCEFCGTTLEDQTTQKEWATGQYPKIIVSSATIPATTLAPDLVREGKRTIRTIGCVFIVLFLLGLSGAVIFLASSSSLTDRESSSRVAVVDVEQPGALRVYSFGLARMLPAGDDSQPDIVGVTRNSDDTERMVYVDFDADQHLRWQSDPLGEGADYVFNPIAADGSFVYLAYETTLVAFDRQDGTIVWQAALSDEIRNICKDCLQVFGDRLVALTADGVLNGIDAQTGELAWSVRLTTTPRQLLNLAGKAGTLDEEDGVIGIHVYEPATGVLVQRIVPECPNDVFPNRPQRLSIYDPVLVSGDGQNLYVPIGNYEPGCIQNWDADTLTQVWQAAVSREVVRALDRAPYLLTAEALYISDGHNLSVVDLRDGVYREVFGDEDHNLVPLAAQGDSLVILAERTRGTQQYSLWGIDTASGIKRWQFDPDAKDVYEDGSSVAHDDGIWSASVTLDKVVVLEAFSDPSFVTFTVLNLADGTQTSTNKFALGEGGFSFWIQVLGWDRDRVYLEMNSRLRVIDFMTATEIVAWP